MNKDTQRYVNYWIEQVKNNTYSDSEWNRYSLWRYINYTTPVIMKCKDLPLTK